VKSDSQWISTDTLLMGSGSSRSWTNVRPIQSSEERGGETIAIAGTQEHAIVGTATTMSPRADLAEQPFSLEPDPKYLYRSESHANALELLQYAIARREGFVVITGDNGTGKTTLCRAFVENTDRKTFTALLLKPFLSEEDLLRAILQDLGVVSEGEPWHGVRQPSKQELVNTLHDFLLSLVPLDARAVLIIDEAQDLPLSILEQIRILSNFETNEKKLLQIFLVGQLSLTPLLRSPELRQLDQRVSIRYQLKPLREEEVGAYISHRLAIADAQKSVVFSPNALKVVHDYSGGIPRVINMLCDRALLGGSAAQRTRIDEDLVLTAAEGLNLKPSVRSSRSLFSRLLRRT
jgi:general secretion pathway protein A